MSLVKKGALVCSVLLCGFMQNACAQSMEVSSRISEVCVYPDSALVSRDAAVDVSAGQATVVFADLVPALDEDSLRVSAQGSADVKILSARVLKEYLPEVGAEEVRKLQEHLQGLEDEKQSILHARSALEDEKKFLDSFRFFTGSELPKDLVTQIPDAETLTGALSFLQSALADYYARSREAGIALRQLDKQIEAARRKLQEVSGGTQKIKRSIAVDLDVQKAGTTTVRVAYLVWGASWKPQYDARAAFDKAKVEFVTYGIVCQKTGEDWQEVVLSLSTARPSRGGRMPYVAPWLLRPIETRARRAKLEMMESPMAGGAVDAQMEAFSDKDKALPEPEEQLSYVHEKGVAIVYTLPGKVSVPSDGTEHKRAVFSQAMSADFLYSSYPRSTTDAYLGSRVKNAPDAQLLAGTVQVFIDGDYVGVSSVDAIGPGEEFDLYLGVDENVKVKREQVEKKVDQTLIAGIPSNSRRTRFTYKLTVENYKTKPATVKLFEALPVSEDDRIKVKIESVTREPKQKEWEDRRGVWLWELTLAPGAKHEITYTFSVEHPRAMDVEGL